MVKKGLAFAIVVLFIGAGAVSALDSNQLNNVAIKKPKVISVRGDIAYAWAAYGNYSGLVEFDLDDPGNLTFLSNGSGFFFFSGSDFDPDGNWYAVSYSGGLYFIDLETGDVTLIANTIPCDSLVYDTTTGIWYIASGNALYTIDINTGATTLIGSFGIANYMISIMVDTSGNMYGYDVLFGGNSTLYSIDKTTGAATVIGDMGHDFCYAQEGKFDRNDGTLYLVAYDVGMGQTYLATCDPATGAVTIIGQFLPAGIELDGFAIPYGSSNQYPHANFTWTPTNPLPGETILFNASASYDPDGYISLYEWDWNDDGMYEESHTTPTATHSWVSPGSYKVILRVTDNSSLTGKKSKTVEVVNQPPPTPEIYGPTNGTVNVEYTFTIGPITDPEGDSMYCKWDWGDGNITDWLGPYLSGQTFSASHLWTEPGVYEIRAKLKDTYGAESHWSGPYIITILENKPPSTPDIHGTAKGKPGVTYLYTFNTTDPENDLVYYYVDWGDKNNSGWLGPYDSGVQKSASHSWSQKGTYTVKVKAKDIYGNESDWGALPVTIPLTYDRPLTLFFDWLFERFPHAFPILRCLLTWYKNMS